MSFSNPAEIIVRRSVQGRENEWVKIFDPPTASPPTCELLAPTNPVPEVMAAAGLQTGPAIAHTISRSLMHGTSVATWDGLKNLVFYQFMDVENPSASGGTWPGPTVRIPRGAIFHSTSQGAGPPPHTIHWHGQEPTPMNDGVGHCSMEIGSYTYQFQPNFIGTYFYHCHRNTVQHFEFGLYGMFLVMCPDTYFATQQNPGIPIGACRDGKFRTAGNLSKFPQFPGFNSNPLTAPDPEGQFQTDPHAMTITYDVDALWVPDDRDSVWSDNASSPFATFPRAGGAPGVNDLFHQNPGTNGFFAFNQFDPDYWFVTGVPVPAHKGETGTIPNNIVIPAALNSGVSGTQVSINAQVGQTILIRCLDAAYDCIETTFPVDVTIIAWDGRALGVPPYGAYNEAYLVPAGTPIHQSVARRFDALVRPTSPINSFVTVEFVENEGQVPGESGFDRPVVFTARIPFNIAPAAPGAKFTLSGRMTNQTGAGEAGATISLGGAAVRTTTTNAFGYYQFADLANGNYTLTPAAIALSVITPANKELSINGADVTAQNFTVAPATFAVSGLVTNQASGAALSGVTISLTGPANQTIVTGAAGTYSLAGLTPGDYTLTPALDGFTFNPPSVNVTVGAADVTGRNFAGAATPTTAFGISGILLNQSGAPLSAVSVVLSGAASRTAVTDASGNYTITGLANGSYTVTPTETGVTFSPVSRNVVLDGADVATVSFVGVGATSAVSGRVLDAQGAPIAGATVNLSGPANRTVVTDSTGNYSITGLPTGNYSISLSSPGVVFSPDTLTVALTGSAAPNQNFSATVAAATFSLSGRIINQSGAAVAGVAVVLSGAASRTVVTDASGNYSLTGLSNGAYTVSPSATGLTFTPASANVTINGANVVSQNFIATEPGVVTTFTITGRVTNQAGTPLAGVTVTLSGDASQTATTNASGNFTLSGLTSGHFSVTPALSNFSFGPFTRHVALGGSGITGIDFVGTQVGLGFQHRIMLPFLTKESGAI